MSDTLEYLQTFARFPFALRRFLQHRLTLDEAKQIVRERMEHREENFLRLVETSIYGYPRSPYLPLLKMAGCELGDLRVLVKQKGIEGTLRELREEGVYVTNEEYKGRKPIERNGLVLPVAARDFDNPFAESDLLSASSGSTGASTQVAIDLDFIAARASHRMLLFAAHSLLQAPTLYWRGIMPDRTLGQILTDALNDTLPQRWFSSNALRDSRHWVKYALGTYYLIGCMRLAGIKIPLPEYVKLDEAVRVAEWSVETVKTYGRCLIRTGTSRAVHVCVAAERAGLDLNGVTFMGAGEPATTAKEQQIERVGARFISNYGMSDTSQVAGGCVNRQGISDYHLYQDTFALFSYPHHLPAFDITVPAFNLTMLSLISPKIMLNVQVDDYGIIEERHCGCELETYGLTTHVREVQSYSKLTGEGVTLIGDEIIKILEHVLPVQLGGSALDYQLMEQEDEHGITRLYLIISPNVPLVSEAAAVECFLSALRAASPMADATRLVWQNAKSIQVKRMQPIWTARQKFLPLHLPSRYDLRRGDQA